MPPSQMKTASPSAQRNDVTPWENAGRRIGALDSRQKKNSPSRWRFRPPNPLAFRLRVQPPGPASTYSRSVLGASGTLRRLHGAFKRPEVETVLFASFRFDPFR